jgi:energy-coupling factor transporter ATP-binding protein EcfA2
MGKLILIEGMSGSGKSTAAQYLALAISQSGSKSDWYHEEQTNHPIYTEEYDRYLESGQVNKFVTKILSNWEKFLANTGEDSVAHIFEAQILQAVAASILWSGYDEGVIKQTLSQLSDLLAGTHYTFFFLHTGNPELILNNSFKRRGKAWKNWYIDFFNKSGYSKQTARHGIDGLSEFWKEIYQIGCWYYDRLTSSKLLVDITNQDWAAYKKKLLDFFGISYELDQGNRSTDLKQYTGQYRDAEGNFECTVKFEGDYLYCDFGWPGLHLIPKNKNHEFYIMSFPHELKFISKNDRISEIEVTGKDIAGLLGKKLRREVL